MPNVDPLKPKIMKLTHTQEVAFNINGTTIHFALAIPLNKNYNEPKTLSDVKQMVTIDEISLVGNIMLTFIDRKLHDIKQTHNEFMDGLDVIMISDLYQTSPSTTHLLHGASLTPSFPPPPPPFFFNLIRSMGGDHPT